AGFEGKAECELKKHIPIPIGGVLALVLAVTVPIGLTAGAEGKITAVDVELGPKGHLGTNVTIGFQCDTAACWAIKDHTPDASNGITFESKVNLLRDMRVEANMALNFVTGLGFHVGTEDYSLIDAKIGPVESLNLAFDDAQARDQAYASGYEMRVAGSVTPGDDLKTAISRLFGGAVSLDLSASYKSDPATESPKGTLSVEKPRVELGQPVGLYVDLDPTTMNYFPIGPNVVELRVFRLKDDRLTPVATMPINASGQTRFEHIWTPTREFVGMNELVGFVTTRGLPAVPLEISPRSSAFVEVVEACLGEEPTPGPVQPPASSAPSALPSAPPPAEPSARPQQDCGRGTVTITREKHGTYTSNRNNPVEVDMVDQATITFDLVADEFDPNTLVASSASVTWSYSLNAVESADGCTIHERADGGGTWEGEDGPVVMLGWATPDGTLFGMTLDDTRYVLQAIPPTADMPEYDPRGWYQGSSSICGAAFIDGLQMPYTTMAFVDGPIPEGRSGTFSGSRTRTLPPQFGLDVPTTETVTWSFNVEGSPL
ncbi:MAG TPA: hypothetical protein VEX88_03340, partial [Glaciibacter sp.]|nr:hypothetical protein [Glaciibacter sp.]